MALLKPSAAPGTIIRFKPNGTDDKKKWRKGVYVRHVRDEILEVKLDGDPFTVCVNSQRVEKIKSPTETEKEKEPMVTTKLTAKELRKKARELDIEGWDELGLTALRKAVEEAEDDTEAAPAKKSSKKAAAAKKAPAEKPAKAAAKKAAPKKAASKKAAKAASEDDAEVPENGNPFRKDTNLFIIAEEVIKGGKRSAMVNRLKKKIDL